MNDVIQLLESMNSIKNQDSNYIYNGVKVPRVTHIISRCIHNDGLMYWSNSLGFKHQSYKKTLDKAANIGSICHENIDAFLTDENHKAFDDNTQAINAYNSFLKWWNDIHLYASVEVIFHEHPIVCRYFGGTLDGLYRINGKIYLIDYKTSNHITYNYCLQLAAYIYILRSEYGIEVDGCIILQLSKNDISYNEHVLNFDNIVDKQYMVDCERAFLAMAYWYYNLQVIEQGFNSLGWG